MKRFWRNGLVALTGLLLSATALAEQAPTAVKIAIVAYTQGGKPVFGGIAGRVIEDGWLEQQLSQRGVKLEWIALPHAGAGPQINEGFSNNSIDFAVRGDLPSFVGAEVERVLRHCKPGPSRGQRGQGDAPTLATSHGSCTLCRNTCRSPSTSTSKRSSQRPAMCQSRPSARQRPAASACSRTA